MVNEATMAIVARPGLPAANLAEFAPGVRREGRRLNLGNAGVGSTNHLCRLLLASAIGGPMTLVLCRGNAPVMNDLVAGGLAMGCDQTTNNAEQIRAGAIRVYPVSTPARAASLPGVPTAAEAGLPGCACPAGTCCPPPPVASPTPRPRPQSG